MPLATGPSTSVREGMLVGCPVLMAGNVLFPGRIAAIEMAVRRSSYVVSLSCKGVLRPDQLTFMKQTSYGYFDSHARNSVSRIRLVFNGVNPEMPDAIHSFHMVMGL
jgi:hypothetical protein